MSETESRCETDDATETAGREGLLTTLNRLNCLAIAPDSGEQAIQEALDAALRLTGGLRGFLASIERETGDLVVAVVAGQGWTDERRNLRLQLHNEIRRGITGHVAITGQPHFTGNVAADPYYLAFFEDAVSEIAVPFFDTEGRARGILNVESERPDAFNAAHVPLMTALANVVATAMAFQEYRSRERMLVEVGIDLASTPEIDPLLKRVVDVAATALRCEGCSVFLLDDTTQLLTLRASRGGLDNQIGLASYRQGEGLTGTVALTGETIRLRYPQEDPRWIGRHSEFVPDARGALLIVPIVSRERILGVLRVSRPHSASTWYEPGFTETDERVLRTVAGQLGSAIENVRSFDRVVRSERMAAWGELSAKSAHMIGNRTFAIKGDLNELKYLLSHHRAPAGSEDERRFQEIESLVGSIERGVSRLEEILREFRDFVMATQLTLRDADINQTVRETVAESFPKRSTVVLHEEYASGLPALRFDPEKLKRAFSELIENSVSFQPEGGELKISTRLIEAGRIPAQVKLSPNRKYVEIAFEDRGPGVAEEIKDKIFTPFFTSRVKGMGLGLSIVKGIVDAHHGRIRESGEAGKGARFSIYLPANGDTA